LGQPRPYNIDIINIIKKMLMFLGIMIKVV